MFYEKCYYHFLRKCFCYEGNWDNNITSIFKGAFYKTCEKRIVFNNEETQKENKIFNFLYRPTLEENFCKIN